MTKFVRVLSGAWAVYALFIFLSVVRNFVAFVSTASSGGYHGRAPFSLSVITFVVLGSLSVSLPAVISYLLAVTRHRKAALILAVVSCVGFPIGTILGAVTLITLTRSKVMSEFIQPSNHAMERIPPPRGRSSCSRWIYKHRDMRTLQKTIVIVLGTLAVTLFFSFIALGPYYYSTRPHNADPQSGRIYPERVKGVSGVADVYLTRTERLPYDYAHWILTAYGLLFFSAVLLNHRWKVVRNLTLRGWEYPK